MVIKEEIEEYIQLEERQRDILSNATIEEAIKIFFKLSEKRTDTKMVKKGERVLYFGSDRPEVCTIKEEVVVGDGFVGYVTEENEGHIEPHEFFTIDQLKDMLGNKKDKNSFQIIIDREQYIILNKIFDYNIEEALKAVEEYKRIHKVE